MTIVNMPAPKTINFEFNQTDKVSWLKEFSNFIGNEKFEGNKNYFPENVAKGYAKAGSTEHGLSHLAVNYTTTANINYTKKADDDFKLCFYFYEFKVKEPVTIQMSPTEALVHHTDFDIIILAGNAINQGMSLPHGTTVKGLTVIANQDWIETNLTGKSCPKIAALRNGEFFLKHLSQKDRILLDGISGQDYDNKLLPRVHVNNRILRLIEGTLEDICSRQTELAKTANMNLNDFNSVIAIEKQLSSSEIIEFPSITTLARNAYMSETKLKKIFKQAYGHSLYEYYKKHKLHVAKNLLRAGGKSISQVGQLVGYQNLSNFSLAFKKEFNCLPKDVLMAD
jgi:AraC-like DNA-binding protein